MPDYAGRSGPPTKGAPEAWGATAARQKELVICGDARQR